MTLVGETAMQFFLDTGGVSVVIHGVHVIFERYRRVAQIADSIGRVDRRVMPIWTMFAERADIEITYTWPARRLPPVLGGRLFFLRDSRAYSADPT